MGMREGGMIKIIDDKAKLLGASNAHLFQYGENVKLKNPQDDISFLLK